MKKVLFMTFAVAVMAGCITGWASDRSILATGATLEKVAGGFWFTEGPTTDASGNVFFTDQERTISTSGASTASFPLFCTPAGSPSACASTPKATYGPAQKNEGSFGASTLRAKQPSS